MRVSGQPADAPASQLRAMTINGQFLMFHVKRPQFEPFTTEHARLVKAMVVDQTRALLNRLASESGMARPSPVKGSS